MKSTSHIENLLMDYSKIEKTNYKAKVQFYEERRNKISELLTRDKLELDVDYAFALFELGKYGKCLGILNILVEVVITENIFTKDDEDIFQVLLFKKSACHYNLGEPEKSMHVLQELIKMNPKNEGYKIFFKRCLRNEFKLAYRWMGGLVVGLFLLAAFIISVELLIVRPFYYDSAYIVEITRNSIFAGAILVLVSREYLFHRSFTKRLSFLTKA